MYETNTKISMAVGSTKGPSLDPWGHGTVVPGNRVTCDITLDRSRIKIAPRALALSTKIIHMVSLFLCTLLCVEFFGVNRVIAIDYRFDCNDFELMNANFVCALSRKGRQNLHLQTDFPKVNGFNSSKVIHDFVLINKIKKSPTQSKTFFDYFSRHYIVLSLNEDLLIFGKHLSFHCPHIVSFVKSTQYLFIGYFNKYFDKSDRIRSKWKFFKWFLISKKGQNIFYSTINSSSIKHNDGHDKEKMLTMLFLVIRVANSPVLCFEIIDASTELSQNKLNGNELEGLKTPVENYSYVKIVTKSRRYNLYNLQNKHNKVTNGANKSFSQILPTKDAKVLKKRQRIKQNQVSNKTKRSLLKQLPKDNLIQMESVDKANKLTSHIEQTGIPADITFINSIKFNTKQTKKDSRTQHIIQAAILQMEHSSQLQNPSGQITQTNYIHSFNGSDSDTSLRLLSTRIKEHVNLMPQNSSESFSLNNRKKRKIDTRVVKVVAGSAASLPCDLSVEKQENSVQLVLWIKEGMPTPLYSYDYRDLLGGLPKETKPNANSTLARRTTFQTHTTPAALVIEKVQIDDAGIYRCRVDFLLTPTQNSRVHLTVIVPPSRAKVSWKESISGGALSQHTSTPTADGIVGPFREGDQPIILCSNEDGIPLPSVKWYDGDRLIDDSFFVDSVRKIVTNTYELPPLTRAESGCRLTCQAANVNSTQPATATVTIAMILKILSVDLDVPRNLQAGIKSDINCIVKGSTPIPTIRWWLGAEKIVVSAPQVLESGNITLSVFSFTPSPEHDAEMLICQAVNSQIMEEPMQDSKLLSVNYIPQVSVELGRSLDAERIKEGDDVYFECRVRAKPSVFNIEWKHNNVSLEGMDGVFVSNMSLVVQGVKRSNGGNYTCHAFNNVGMGVSKPLNLNVKYAPVCADIKKFQHSVAKLENAEILCKVHANPPNVTFRWTFNNTAEAIDVPDDRFVVSKTESRVNYTPMNELDYGTLLCWANNSIGVQEHPCVFQIVAAGKPDPPHNCRVLEVTISSMQVNCHPGDDGGLSQRFILQVYKIGSSSPIMEITKVIPTFSVTNLMPATAYKILVVALNEKGASRPSEMKAFTVRIPETQEETSAEPTRDRDREISNIPLSVIIGSSLAVIPLIVIIIFGIWFRSFRKGKTISAKSSFQESDEKAFENICSAPMKDSVQSLASCKDSNIIGFRVDRPISTQVSSTNTFTADVISHTSDPSPTFMKGHISTISRPSSVFFLSPNNSSFIPSNCQTNTSTSVVNFMHLVGSEVNHNSDEKDTGRIRATHSPSTSLMPLTPIVPIHVPYTSIGDDSSVSHKDSIHNIMDIPLPPPDFFNENFQPKNQDSRDKTGTNIDHNCEINGSFCNTPPHIYPACNTLQHTIGENSLTYQLENCKESLQRKKYDGYSFPVGEHSIKRQQDLSVSSLPRLGINARNHSMTSRTKQSKSGPFPHLASQQFQDNEVSSNNYSRNSGEIIFNLGTHGRAKSEAEKGGQLRNSSCSIIGSMPDVRYHNCDHSNPDMLSRNSKTESAV